MALLEQVVLWFDPTQQYPERGVPLLMQTLLNGELNVITGYYDGDGCWVMDEYGIIDDTVTAWAHRPTGPPKP